MSNTTTAIRPEVVAVLKRRPEIVSELKDLVARRSRSMSVAGGSPTGPGLLYAIRFARQQCQTISDLIAQLAAVEGREPPDPVTTAAGVYRLAFSVRYAAEPAALAAAYRQLSVILLAELTARQSEARQCVASWTRDIVGKLQHDKFNPDSSLLDVFNQVGAARVNDLAELDRRLASLAAVTTELAESTKAVTAAAVTSAGGLKSLAIALVEVAAATTPIDHQAKQLKSEVAHYDDQLSQSVEGGRLHASLVEVRELTAKRLREHFVATNRKRQASATAVALAFEGGDSVAIAYVAELHQRQPAAFPAEFDSFLSATDVVSPDQQLVIIASAFDAL
jgi:hypothetical protein